MIKFNDLNYFKYLTINFNFNFIIDIVISIVIVIAIVIAIVIMKKRKRCYALNVFSFFVFFGGGVFWNHHTSPQSYSIEMMMNMVNIINFHCYCYCYCGGSHS